jgi:deoxyinosine 3'endonuclease (endonuclease V)
MEYVPGFLAFREAGHLIKLFERLLNTRPDLAPQVILVDGNGILHQNACGLASHLGVLINTPTIGVGKTVF